MNAIPKNQTDPLGLDDRGATAIEYSILVALIAAIIVLTVEAVGLEVVDLWGSVDW